MDSFEILGKDLERKLGFVGFEIRDLGFWLLKVEMKVLRWRNEWNVVGKG